MKKLLFTLLIMVWSVLAAKADDVLPPYTGFPTIFHHVSMPMQEKFPKFWLLHVEDNDGRFVNFDYRLAGDTLIVDKDYVPVVCGYEWKDDLYGNDFLFIPAVRPNGSEYADTLYYRQEGDKVFCLLPEEGREILIVDYGLQVGDEFTDASGETYVVTEKSRVGEDRYRSFFYYTFKTTEMRLKSKQTGEEETWVEGLGSKDWGITPYFLMERNKVFAETGLKPSSANVSIAYGVNLLIYPHVNTEGYKAEKVDETWVNDTKESPTTFEFVGDTLCVHGVTSSENSTGNLYAECIIEDNRIDVMMKSFSALKGNEVHNVWYDAKIPGFKNGIYQVRMPGQEYVTLECKGATATSLNKVMSPLWNGDVYDLSGRRVNGSKLPRGIYIRDGKKIAVK